MSKESDFSKAYAEHYEIQHPDARMERRWLSEAYWHSLDDAEKAFANLKEGEMIIAAASVGVGHSTSFAPKTAKELFFISKCIGHRTTLYVGDEKDAKYTGKTSFEVLWSERDIIAHSGISKFDVEMTRKTADRKLIWCASPQYVTSKQGVAVSGWGRGRDEEDLMLGGEVKSWEARKIGGRTYFLYPEKGVHPGTCRAVSMSILEDQFKRFPKFEETIKSLKPDLWTTVKAAIDEEHPPLKKASAAGGKSSSVSRAGY